MGNIIVTQTAPPKRKEIKMTCPNCKALLSRWIPLKKQEGDSQCGLCEASFYWKETSNG